MKSYYTIFQEEWSFAHRQGVSDMPIPKKYEHMVSSAEKEYPEYEWQEAANDMVDFNAGQMI
jgi:hypothetical protein